MDSFREYGIVSDDSKGIPSSNNKYNSNNQNQNELNDRLQQLRDNIIGSYHSFSSPYGNRPIVYMDWTASGKAVDTIETYINKEILPFYGNTHTTTSITGYQSTSYRHEARQIIAEATNSKITGISAEDIVLFVGNGTTAAVNKLVSSLGLNNTINSTDDNEVPVVFISTYEHHSNILPWRECGAEVITISYSSITGVCLKDLALKLIKYKNRRIKIGTFSAASNVTGVLTSVDEVSILLHQSNALAFFDYATAAPYVKMDMNPVLLSAAASVDGMVNDGHLYAYKDAIFFSGHKFIGGPGTPGVLIVKKRILTPISGVPTMPGGGTVFYVTNEHHRYLSNREEREEGGTPDVVGDIKLGLALHIKKLFGSSWIQQEEHRISRYAYDRFKSHKNLVVLGRDIDTLTSHNSVKHLPIFSFLIRSGHRFLHYNYVCALLNDLFGIQSRGGCQCAGPFSQELLGISREMNDAIEAALLDKHEVLRPGYSRISLPYWLMKEEIDYVIDGILFVAEHGWKLLHLYRYNPKTGDWAHSTRLTKFPDRRWVSNFDLLPAAAALDSSNGGGDTSSSDTNTCIGSADSGSNTLSKTLNNWLQHDSQYLSSDSRSSSSNASKVIYLLDKFKVDANRLLSEVINKAGKSKGGSNDMHTNRLDYLDEYRWFSLLADADIGHSDLPLKGCLNPYRVDGSVALHIQRHVIVEATPFAQQRNIALTSRTGGEATIPNYVSIFNTAAAAADKSNIATYSSSVTLDKVIESTSVRLLENIGRDTSAATTDTDTAIDANANTNAGGKVEDGPISLAVCSAGQCFTRVNRQVGGIEESLDGRSVNVKTFNSLPDMKVKCFTPSKKLMRVLGQAMFDWSMINDGDRLLLGLSGGKDSLTLLHALLAIQKKAPVKFEIACATVDPLTESYDPSPLIPYLQSLNVSYHYISEPIVEMAKTKLQGNSLCAFCSRLKRGLLYGCCRKYRYNKLVLGQHLDDLAESFFMSMFHNGRVRTMKANYVIDEGDISVIRPLVYAREYLTKEFSKQYSLPIINENCPACFENPKERARMKKLMVQEEAMYPNLFSNLKKSFMPFMDNDIYAELDKITDNITNANNVAHAATANYRKNDNTTSSSGSSSSGIVAGKRKISNVHMPTNETSSSIATVKSTDMDKDEWRDNKIIRTSAVIVHTVKNNSDFDR